MSTIEKLRDKFYEKPVRNDLTFDEVCRLAKSYGCQVDTNGGRHGVRIIYAPLKRLIPIPRHGNTVQEAYIKQLRDLFDEIETIR